MEWNEPLFVEGSGPNGRIGVLVIHGFGGSPRSLQELAERLAAAGYTVALPLLAGHGRTPEAMEASRWTEWTGDVEQAYQWLRARTDRVFVCGLSMGGTLALWVAERHPDLAGLITINTIIRHPLETVMLRSSDGSASRGGSKLSGTMPWPRVWTRRPTLACRCAPRMNWPCSHGRCERASAGSRARLWCCPRQWIMWCRRPTRRRSTRRSVRWTRLRGAPRLLPPGHDGLRQGAGLHRDPGVHRRPQLNLRGGGAAVWALPAAAGPLRDRLARGRLGRRVSRLLLDSQPGRLVRLVGLQDVEERILRERVERRQKHGEVL